MRVVGSWLQEFLSKNLSSQQMTAAMEAAGIEVEAVEQTASLDSRIIAAKVLKLKPVKDSSHLQLATVDIGSQTVSVVCGAPNVREGQLAVLAQVGARLPDDSLIESRLIRGQRSRGMLLSPKELGLGEDHSGLLELEPEFKIGTPLEALFGGRDTVFDISVAANRPDLRSLIGVAREVAAHSGLQLRLPKIAALPKPTGRLFTNKVPALSPRYSLTKLQLSRDLGASPAWLQRRLQLAGTRPINLVVDITNYVMLETGQPLHGFDAAKLKGKVTVRRAKDRESLKTLDGKQRRLSSEDIAISDSRGAIAIGGVMGGADTEMGAATTDILLEAATFNGVSIRRTAIRQGLVSEASLRFQHQLPLGFVTLGTGRALQLFKELAAAKVTSFDDQGRPAAKPRHVTVDIGRMNQLLGIATAAKTAAALLKRLGFGVQATASRLAVTVPDWRPDVSLAEDIYEEVIKLVGLDKVPARLPNWRPGQVAADSYWPKLWELRELLRGLGLSEVTTYPFVSQAQITNFGLDGRPHLRLQNPLSDQQTHLRTTLAPNLVQAAADNTRRRESFGLFEIGRVFSPARNQPLANEVERLGIVVQRSQRAYQAVKYVLDQFGEQLKLKLSLNPAPKLAFLHPARQAEVATASQPLGDVGELNPLLGQQLKLKGDLGYLELDLKDILSNARDVSFQPLGRYPAVQRDLTLQVANRVSWQEIAAAITGSGLARPEYGGDFYDNASGAERSLTIRLEMTAAKTMREAEIKQRVEGIVKLLKQKFAARLKD